MKGYVITDRSGIRDGWYLEKGIAMSLTSLIENVLPSAVKDLVSLYYCNIDNVTINYTNKIIYFEYKEYGNDETHEFNFTEVELI